MGSGERINLRYTPSAAFQVSGITQPFRGANAYRPNVIGDPLAPAGERSITNYFDKANVVLPTDPSQPFGDAKRYSVTGIPSARSTSRSRSPSRCPWSESRLQSAEAFNLFNRDEFRAANSNRSSAGFGTITSTYDARQIQLGVKLLF